MSPDHCFASIEHAPGRWRRCRRRSDPIGPYCYDHAQHDRARTLRHPPQAGQPAPERRDLGHGCYLTTEEL
jgi:hypothetical protein